jgi:hypothetical protein
MGSDHRVLTGATPPSPDSIARSMATLGNSLTELVDRMEAEVASRHSITVESASELRSLRVEAERFFMVEKTDVLQPGASGLPG